MAAENLLIMTAASRARHPAKTSGFQPRNYRLARRVQQTMKGGIIGRGVSTKESRSCQSSWSQLVVWAPAQTVRQYDWTSNVGWGYPQTERYLCLIV
jgi:hypothetical protein